MNKRDWQADMTLCEKATQEPWVSERAKLLPWSTVYPQDSFKFICERVKHEDADFIAEARTALPYWLRQYAAEKERAEKARQLLYDAIGSLVFSTGPNNEHVKRITERFKSLYPKEEPK